MCKYHFYAAACKGEVNVNYFRCCWGGLFLSNPITTLAQGKPHEGRKQSWINQINHLTATAESAG